MTNAQHSQATDEHGSPPEVISLAAAVGGRIDTDPCTSDYWNFHGAKARIAWTVRDNGLVRPWEGFIICNPPGANKDRGTKSLVRPFWERLVTDWRGGLIDGAIWVGYSLESLVQLQDAPACPTQFPTVIPASRLCFLRRPPNGGPPQRGDQPTHGNYISLLPSRRDPARAKQQMAVFVQKGGELGALVRPLL